MGYFIWILMFVIVSAGTFFYFDPNFENIQTFYNIKNEENIQTYDNPNNVLKQQNFLDLEPEKNKIFKLKNDYNLYLNAQTLDENNQYIENNDKGSNIAIEAINKYSKDFETLTGGKDYIVEKCSRGASVNDCNNFSLESKGDYIIYKINGTFGKKINQLIMNNNGIVINKISLSFLKENRAGNTVFLNKLDYYLNPGTNILKFPLIELLREDKLYVKVKLEEKDI